MYNDILQFDRQHLQFEDRSSTHPITSNASNNSPTVRENMMCVHDAEPKCNPSEVSLEDASVHSLENQVFIIFFEGKQEEEEEGSTKESRKNKKLSVCVVLKIQNLHNTNFFLK